VADLELSGKNPRGRLNFSRIEICVRQLTIETPRIQKQGFLASRRTFVRVDASAWTCLQRVVPPGRGLIIFLSEASSGPTHAPTPICERGFRTRLDERDLLPEGNLVDEIFSHGIAKSDIVVVVLCATSTESKWVHEELTNAVVQKIDGVVKMIIPSSSADIRLW
jgi:hypothetical protein